MATEEEDQPEETAIIQGTQEIQLSTMPIIPMALPEVTCLKNGRT